MGQPMNCKHKTLPQQRHHNNRNPTTRDHTPGRQCRERRANFLSIILGMLTWLPDMAHSIPSNHISITDDFAFIYSNTVRLNPEFVKVVRRVNFDSLTQTTSYMAEQTRQHTLRCERLLTSNTTNNDNPNPFSVYNHTLSHTAASSFCESHAAKLPEVRNAEDEYYLRTLMRENNIERINAGIENAARSFNPVFLSDHTPA